MRRIAAVLALLTLSLAAFPAAQGRPAPEALARSLQQRYQGVRDFSASFVHTYRGGALRTQTREQGTVEVKKPGMMRFIYTAPERKEFVSDGKKIYSYVPQDRQVIVSTVPADNQISTPTLFLAGKGDIVRDFTAEYAETNVPGSVSLKLTPKRQEPDYDYFILTVEPTTLRWLAITTRDKQGGDSTISFSNLKENVGLSDKAFAFKVPSGVDVIEGASN